MATAGDIVVNLTANSTKFTSGLKKAEHELGAFTEKILELGTEIGTAVAGFLAFEKIKEIFEETSDRLAKLAGESERLGISAQSLSEIGYAAKLSHTSIEALTGGLRKMEAVLGKAGIKADAKETFLTIADAVKQMTGAGQFNQAGNFVRGIFGKGGQELLPLLSRGREGIQALGDEFREMGGGDMDAMAEGGAKIEEAFKRIETATELLKNSLMAGLAPVFLDVIAPAAIVATKALNEFIGGGEITNEVGAMGVAFAGLADVAQALYTPLAKLNEWTGVFRTGLSVITDSLSTITGAWDRFAKAINGTKLPEWMVPGGFDGASIKVPTFGTAKEIAKDVGLLPEGKTWGDKLLEEIEKIREGSGIPHGPHGPDFDFGGDAKKPKAPAHAATTNLDVFSKEGFSVFARAATGQSKDVPQQQLAEAKKGNTLLQKIADAVKDQQQAPVGEEI